MAAENKTLPPKVVIHGKDLIAAEKARAGFGPEILSFLEGVDKRENWTKRIKILACSGIGCLYFPDLLKRLMLLIH